MSPDLVIEPPAAPAAGAVDVVDVLVEVVDGAVADVLAGAVLEDVELADAGLRVVLAFFFLTVCFTVGLAIDSFVVVVAVDVVVGGVVVAGAAAGAGVDGAVDGAAPCASAVALKAAATRAIRSLLMESSW